MSVIVVGSIKGSPGATTSALALAATWPAARQVMVAECDRAGGDIAARFGLPSEPGLVSLSAASRHSGRSPGIQDHVATLPGGLPVLLAPASAAQTCAALSVLREPSFLDVADTDVIVDVGRITPDAASGSALIRAATLVVVVTRTSVADLHHVAEGVRQVEEVNASVAALLIGAGQYGGDEIQQTTGIDLVGALPHDPVGAAALAGASMGGRGFGRLALLRSARTVAESIVARFEVPAEAAAESVA